MDSLLALNLGWRDVADVLVISYVVHRLVLLFWGTTALQVALALAFLRLVLAVAEEAGLVLTSWLFEGLNSVAVLVIVVVFRNEIREALIQSNPVRLLVGRPETSKAVDFASLSETAFRLARDRTGALIVIQNRDRVAEHVREGVPLNGRFSAPVIEALFVKDSPVHDGAAVIRGGRIERVGAFLPLSRSPGLPAEFGTRHRAAVGLTERCDAVVVVVSEERGEVSVVHRRAVETVEDPGELEQALRRRLGREALGQRPRTWAREAARLAVGYLLTVLAVAGVALWGLHANRQQSLRNLAVTVAYRNIPEDLELRDASEQAVEVHISGKRPLVDALSVEQVGASVDLGEVGPGVHDVTLSANNVTLPPGLDLVKVVPDTLRVTLEPRVSRPVPVEPALAGDAPDGYRLRAVAQPAAVRLIGPESVLQDLGALSTEPIPIADLTAERPRKAVEAALVLSPASLKLAEGEPRRVRVDVQLVPEAEAP